MRKNKNTKFKKTDLAILLFCLAGAGVSGISFWNEYNRTLSKLNEDPVGIIVFKKRTAQRKFIDRVVWDRLRQTSPVYNGDTVRTTEQSEAVIVFQDEETNLILDENTLIQIFYDGQRGARIDLTGGNLEVVSGSKGIAISSGSSAIVVEGQANLNRSGEGFSLSVLEGNVSFDGTGMSSGSMLALDSGGRINTSPMITMSSFGASAFMLGVPGGKSPVDFSWKEFNFGPDTHVIVEVAEDRGFTRIVETRDVSGAQAVFIPLENGNYRWRAYPANGGSREPSNRSFPSGTLEVIPAVTPVLIAPARAEDLSFSGESRVPFLWSAVESASAYLLEISANANMSAPVVSRRVEKNSVTQTGLKSGRWFWRITPVFPARIKGSVSPSAVSEFSVAPGSPVLAAPVLTFPQQNGKMYLDSRNYRLLWAHDPNALSWFVEMADNPRMANPAVREVVNSNYYSLPGALLQNGKVWYWRVSARGGVGPSVSEVRNFEVSSGNPPSTGPVLAAFSPAPPPPAPPVRAAPTPEPVQVPPPPPRPTPPIEQPARVPVVPPPPPIVQPPPPIVEQPPEPVPDPMVSGADAIFSVLAVISGAGTVSGNIPPEGYILTTGQLESVSSINFVWEGKSPEYRFALYRMNGDVVIPPSDITVSSYTLMNPGLLTEDDYVWQVFERDSRRNWGELPSTAIRFSVVRGEAIIGTMELHDPGVLYGNQ
jgi:hypothetical protein